MIYESSESEYIEYDDENNGNEKVAHCNVSWNRNKDVTMNKTSDDDDDNLNEEVVDFNSSENRNKDITIDKVHSGKLRWTI